MFAIAGGIILAVIGLAALPVAITVLWALAPYLLALLALFFVFVDPIHPWIALIIGLPAGFWITLRNGDLHS